GGVELDDPVADLLGHLVRQEPEVEELELAARDTLGAVLPRGRHLAVEVGVRERVGERQLGLDPLPLVLRGGGRARVPPGARRGEVEGAERLLRTGQDRSPVAHGRAGYLRSSGMGTDAHRAAAAAQGPVPIGLVTVSDTRTEETDENGIWLRAQVE